MRIVIFATLALTSATVDAQDPCHTCSTSILPPWPQRKLSLNDSSESCSICGSHEVVADYSPPYQSNGELPPNLTCLEFEARAHEIPVDSEICSALQVFFPQCCYGPPTYQCETAVRKKLLQEQEYDSAVPPIMSAYRESLVVYVELGYQTVEEIDVQKGTANIFATIDLEWHDPRLAWQVGQEDCADLVSVQASNDVEKTEIWVPDFDLFNQIEGVQSFPDAKATVFPDGTVDWTRTGSLKTICQFQGLAKIPFDTLSCQLLLGARERLGTQHHAQYRLWNGTGLEFGPFAPVYNEYTIVKKLSKSGQTADSSVLYFNFFFQRAKHHYIFNIVIPTILLTYLSFGAFLLDLRIGERLSYGMSLAMVIVAQQIVTGDLIPVSNERLWIDKFVGWSFYWVIFGLIESVLLAYLFFLRQDHMILQNSEPLAAERKAALGLASQYHLAQVDSSEGCSGEMPTGSGEDSAKSEGDEEEVLSRESSEAMESYHSNPEQGENPDVAADYQRVSPKRIFKVPLRRLDQFCFLFTVVSYTTYIIAMFATTEKWGSRVESTFFDEHSSLLEDD